MNCWLDRINLNKKDWLDFIQTCDNLPKLLSFALLHHIYIDCYHVNKNCDRIEIGLFVSYDDDLWSSRFMVVNLGEGNRGDCFPQMPKQMSDM